MPPRIVSSKRMESFANLFPVTGKNSGKTSPLESSFDGKCPISAKLPGSQRTKPKMKQGLTGKNFRLLTSKSPRLGPPSRITLGRIASYCSAGYALQHEWGLFR